MPTHTLQIRGGERIGNVCEQATCDARLLTRATHPQPVQGADMKGIMKLVADNAMPPAPELPRAAEQAKTAANVGAPPHSLCLVDSR